jgi:hypothetical protein
MATIIDSLVVLLGLDKSNFDKGQKDAQASLQKTTAEAEKARKKHEESAKKTAEAYGAVRESILGVTAAIVTAVAGGEFLSFLTKNDTAAGNLARNIGTTVKQVSALEGVFRRMGSSTAGAEAFLRTSNKIVQDIRFTGTSSALLPFAQAGLDPGAFRDAASDPQKQLQLLQNAARKMDPQQAQYRLQAAGYDESTINIILQTRVALKDLFEQQQKMNVLSQKDIDLAFERQQVWGDLGETFEGIGRKIANTLTPALVSAANGLKNFLLWTNDHGPAAVAIISSLGGALLLLKGYSITTMAAAFSGNIAIMGAAVGGLLGKLGILGATFGITFGIASWINEKTGLSDWIADKISPNGPSMAGGYVPGTVKGLKAGGGAGDYAAVEKKWGLPAGLLSGIKGAETGKGSGVGARSSKGAQGPFQFIPSTASAYGLSNPDDPAASAEAAGHYLHDLLAMYGGNVNSAIAAYNEGPGNFNKGYMPSETRKYLETVNGGMSAARSRSGGGGVSIGNMTVQTSASTMTGVGKDAGDAIMQRYVLAQQANFGQN